MPRVSRVDPVDWRKDEPTAYLTRQEATQLFALIGRLKAKGVTIVYISHRLEEVFQLADRVSILRDGQLVSTQRVAETNEEKLITGMIARTTSGWAGGDLIGSVNVAARRCPISSRTGGNPRAAAPTAAAKPAGSNPLVNAFKAVKGRAALAATAEQPPAPQAGSHARMVRTMLAHR